MYDVLQIVNLVLVILVGIANVYTIYTTPGRKKKQQLEEENKKEKKRKEDQAETYRCLLRSIIVRSYRENAENKTINQYEFEEIAKTYENYKKLGGNSFINKIWDEMQSWQIIP